MEFVELKSFERDFSRSDMKNKTYYDYIKEGLQDLQDYLNGDLSKGRECTMAVEEPSFVESTSSDIKLKIKESDEKVNTRKG